MDGGEVGEAYGSDMCLNFHVVRQNSVNIQTQFRSVSAEVQLVVGGSSLSSSDTVVCKFSSPDTVVCEICPFDSGFVAPAPRSNKPRWFKPSSNFPHLALTNKKTKLVAFTWHRSRLCDLSVSSVPHFFSLSAYLLTWLLSNFADGSLTGPIPGQLRQKLSTGRRVEHVCPETHSSTQLRPSWP